MLIALDFDGVFTEADSMWLSLVGDCADRGHKVITVTSRRNTLENRQAMEATGVTWPIVFAYDKPKKLAAIEAGYKVDVWVDDNPHGIGDGTESVATQSVFEIELRHALERLRELAGFGHCDVTRQLIERIETVIGGSAT